MPGMPDILQGKMKNVPGLLILVLLASFCKTAVPAGEKTSDQYIADLSSGDMSLQITAARKLGERKEEQAIPALVSLLDSNPAPEVAWNVAASLGAIGKPGPATAALQRSANSPSPSVKYASIAALTNLHDKDQKAQNVQAASQMRDSTRDDLLKDLADKAATLMAR
jgi:HEAT repeat protein